MEAIIVIAVVVAIWVYARSRKKSTEIPIEISISTSYKGRNYDSDRVVDTGKISKSGEGTFCLNPKAALPLTLKGLSQAEAKNIKKMLDGEAQWQRNIGEITFLIAQNNIECLELEDFIEKAKVEVSNYIENKKTTSDEWEHSSEKDKADLTHEFQMEALENLSTKASNEQALETLIYSEPGDVTADDKLLEVFSGNKDLYRFYISNLGRSSKACKVQADDYYRKNWESLVKLGLAKRGKDIDVMALLDGLRMKDINEYFADRLDKKLSRKAAAVEYAANQPDVLDVLSNHMSFREMFQLSEPEGVEISAIKKCYEYASAQTEVIRDTYVTGYRILDTLAEAKEADYDGWEIEAEDCCQQCSKLNGKKTKKKPSKLPPYHIGCTCSLEGVYD